MRIVVNYTKNSIVRSASVPLRQQFKVSVSILVLIGLLWLLLGSGRLVGETEIARAASDPVIAVVGDIACDPASSNFNGGNGTSIACRQQYTSDLVVNA